MPMWDNFQSMEEWERVFLERGFKTIDRRHLGFLSNTLHRANTGLLVLVKDLGSGVAKPRPIIPNADEEVKNLIAERLTSYLHKELDPAQIVHLSSSSF